MSEISASLLGQVHIEANGVSATLPFKQAEALLYYLLVEKEVPRSRIAGLIWGDTFDESNFWYKDGVFSYFFDRATIAQNDSGYYVCELKPSDYSGILSLER